jgi:tetratricopeptide (TPR) repeat protein
MRRITITSLLGVLLLTTLAAAAAPTKSAAVLLREGLYAEEVEGNLDTAIGIYQQVIADPTAPKNLVAQALYRQGMCLMKKKNEAEARSVFQKLVTDYSDQTELVEKVRPILEELGNADPASLMPPETLVYVELGSPGRQMGTILNMLKGTPLEDPLSVIAARNNAGGTAGHVEGPAQIVNALLNPSMMAEFKKIRGVGIGIMEIAQNNPPALIVLFPGRSDALRGIATMALSMLGQASSPMEGMQVVHFGEGGGAAYDDNVILLATPSPKAAELLQWAIKQYKGRTNLPSLASANKSFNKIGKQARQQNAVTVWLNASEAYQRLLKLMPPDQVPPQFHMADGLANLKDIDDLYAFLSLRETGIALEANVNFKPGYQSMAWSLIRTPNLNKAYFQAIPAQAVALVSFGLGEAGTPQALAASEQIKNALGLDLGAQIFGNIEQITLFAAPPREAMLPEGAQLPPAVLSLGVAIASKNPQETQKLLLTLLQAANLVTGGEQAAALPATGQFEIALAINQKVFGYTDEASKIMVLSLNPQVISASATALKQNASVLNGGTLQDALATLSPTTSKLVLLNVGGTLQLVAQSAQFGSDESAKKARQCVEELIQATQKTTLRLQTNESSDSFGVRVSLSDLPPLQQIFGPVTQLAQMFSQSRAHVGAGAPAPAPVSIIQAGRAPTIDGSVDDVWTGAAAQTIGHVAYTPPSSQADLSADFKTLYDKEALYFLVDVTDDQLVSDSVESWLDDGVEIFIDADNSKSNVYGDHDYQFHFDWDSTAPAVGESHHNQTAGVQYAFARRDGGYRLEAKIPWSTLGVTPAPGKRIGLDVQVNDDDDGGDRDSKIMWHAQRDTAWQQPSVFGTGELAGLLGWWKLDETAGTQAADSSGNGHNATVQGNPQWQPTGGRIGGAIALDGNGAYLEVADESAFDATAGVTVAAWIKVASFDKPWQAIVTKGEGAWRIQRNNETSTIEFACTGVGNPNHNEYGSLYGQKAITPGEWHHIAGVYNGKKMCLYVDGARDASQDAWGPIGVDDNPVLIGENGQIRGRCYNGLIDDVRVYNFGLTEAQVRQLCQEGK